jgi:SAM-dependent methyltransferase
VCRFSTTQGIEAVPKDYHEYVFKDGKFIGAFEEMYQNCEDPWLQDELSPYANDLVLWELAKRKYQTILDLGCGLGKFTHQIWEATKANVVGIDVSPTAIQKAKARYPNLDYRVGDVCSLDFPKASVDLVISSELLWYILPRLQQFLDGVFSVLHKGGEFIIIQQFYQPGEQQYGSEIVGEPRDLAKRIPLKIERIIEIDRYSNHKCIIIAAKQ